MKKKGFTPERIITMLREPISGFLEEGGGVDLVVKFFLKERSSLLVEKCFILVGNCGSQAIKRQGHSGPAILSNGGGVWS